MIDQVEKAALAEIRKLPKGDRFIEVTGEECARMYADSGIPGVPPVRAMKNQDYIVQVFEDQGEGIYTGTSRTRISVQRTGSNAHLRRAIRDNRPIGWDELQWLKLKLGYGDRWFIEIYPPESETVNVANMRHLFLVKSEEVPFAWRSK